MLSLDEVASRFQKATKTAKGYKACCSAHPDNNPSMTIEIGDTGKILFTCFSKKCHYEAIMNAVGLTKDDCWPDKPGFEKSDRTPQKAQSKSESSTVYDALIESYVYTDEIGDELFVVDRKEPSVNPDGDKIFPQRHKDATGKYIGGMKGVRRVLYKLPLVMSVKPMPDPSSKQIWIVEGERKADWLVKCGVVATCNAMGASNWIESYNEALRGKDIIICADNDEPGQKHARTITKHLKGVAYRIQYVKVPDRHNDIVDYLREMKEKKCTLKEIQDVLVEMVMQSVTCMQTTHEHLKSLTEIVADESKRLQTARPFEIDLSQWLYGLKWVEPLGPGDLVSVLADTNVGKSQIIQNIVQSAKGIHSIFFEMEIKGKKIAHRFAASHCGVNWMDFNQSMKDGTFANKDYFDKELIGRLKIVDQADLDIDKMKSIVNDYESVVGERPALVVVDYIQLMSGKDGSSRYEKTSYVAESLKKFANEADVAVIVASQVGRDKEEPNRKIGLHDAKDSGSIENSAQLVIGAHRDPVDKKLLYVYGLKATHCELVKDVIECDMIHGRYQITQRPKKYSDGSEDGV